MNATATLPGLEALGVDPEPERRQLMGALISEVRRWYWYERLLPQIRQTVARLVDEVRRNAMLYVCLVALVLAVILLVKRLAPLALENYELKSRVTELDHEVHLLLPYRDQGEFFLKQARDAKRWAHNEKLAHEKTTAELQREREERRQAQAELAAAEAALADKKTAPKPAKSPIKKSAAKKK